MEGLAFDIRGWSGLTRAGRGFGGSVRSVVRRRSLGRMRLPGAIRHASTGIPPLVRPDATPRRHPARAGTLRTTGRDSPAPSGRHRTPLRPDDTSEPQTTAARLSPDRRIPPGSHGRRASTRSATGSHRGVTDDRPSTRLRAGSHPRVTNGPPGCHHLRSPTLSALSAGSHPISWMQHATKRMVAVCKQLSRLPTPCCRL